MTTKALPSGRCKGSITISGSDLMVFIIVELWYGEIDELTDTDESRWPGHYLPCDPKVGSSENKSANEH